MDAALVLSCLPADYDAATATCAAPFYSFPEPAFPTMTIADAQEIGMAIALLWATAWCLKMLRKAIQEIG